MKNPTTRKLKRQGLTAIRYRTQRGQVAHGWIIKTGRKWLHVELIGAGKKRVPLSEARYIKQLEQCQLEAKAARESNENKRAKALGVQ